MGIPGVLLAPFRMLLSGWFSDEQLASFLTGAFTVGLLWLLTVLQNCVPDTFCREWTTVRSFDADDETTTDDLSFVDPWNAPLTYVSTQQRRMVQNSISTMADIQKHIGELPQRFQRKHWPWETIRRKVLGEESEHDDDDDDLGSHNHSNHNEDGDEPSASSLHHAEDAEEKKDDPSGDGGASGQDPGSTEGGATHTQQNLDGASDHSTTKKDEKRLCIGSIFGLDVGGTLAKLVYFEKKALDSDPLRTRSLREKHYVQAVSAQTVLMARMHPPNHNSSNNKKNINRDHLHRSTSMSPRRKFPNDSSANAPNRIRSSTAGDEEVVIRNLIKPINKVSGRMPRRRTVAIDTSGRDGSDSDSDQEEDTTQRLPQHESSSHTKKPSSSDDLKNLYAIRQVSLPDDIEQFQNSVGFLPTTEGEMVRSESKESVEDPSPNTIENDDDDENDSRGNTPFETSLSSSALASQHTLAPPSAQGLYKKRSKSMLDLSAQQDRQKAEALNRFYDFARRLDTHEDSISDIELSFYCRELGGEFHFISFETRKMKNAMDLIRFNNLHMNIKNMGATGGGAHKFANTWEQELGIGMIKQDELDSLVAGMQFVLSTVVGECFTFRPKEDPATDEKATETTNKTPVCDRASDDHEVDSETSHSETTGHNINNKAKIIKLDRWTRKVQRDTISYSSAYPYMLVTIGTGVSVLRVDGPRKHERVSGSTIGGGTFWGLMRLLTDVENFEEAMKLAEKGDPTKVDMMVGDIYGKDSDALEKLGLAADIVASSFGKLVSKDDPARGLTQEDLARALLSLVTNNIGQVAYLNAKLHHTPRIYFVGSFLRHNMISQRRLSYAIDYWSKGEMEALFLEHEGYFGALGAFLVTQNIEKRDGGFFQWRNTP